MNVRTQKILLAAALLGAAALYADSIARRLRRPILEGESAQRLEAIMERSARIAQDAMATRDPLMLINYLQLLRRTHPELSYASLTFRGHTVHLGSKEPGLVLLARSLQVQDKRPSLGRISPAPGRERLKDSLAAGKTRPSKDVVVIRLGFVPEALQEELLRAGAGPYAP